MSQHNPRILWHFAHLAANSCSSPHCWKLGSPDAEAGKRASGAGTKGATARSTFGRQTFPTIQLVFASTMQSNFEWRSIAHAPMITARHHEAERVIWRQTSCLQHRTERPAATSHAVQNSVAPSDEGDPTHLPQPCEASKTGLTTGPGAERYLIFQYGILAK